MTAPETTIIVRVELFGLPRLRSGVKQVDLLLPDRSGRQQVLAALARACPALVGNGLRGDLADLQEGYLFNRNGTSFLDGEDLDLRTGDCLLLLSGQAGG